MKFAFAGTMALLFGLTGTAPWWGCVVLFLLFQTAVVLGEIAKAVESGLNLLIALTHSLALLRDEDTEPIDADRIREIADALLETADSMDSANLN